jgi:superfamily I DNA/RNA helicase
MRRGHDILKPPRIHLDTIHGVKGGEADNVILHVDMTRRVARTAEKKPDPEHRVFYVGATRARNNLFLVAPKTDIYYRI